MNCLFGGWGRATGAAYFDDVELKPAPGTRRGTVKAVDVRAEFQKHMRRSIGTWRPIKAVIDTANGMGGLEVPIVLEGTNLQWKGLFLEIDGTFPNH